MGIDTTLKQAINMIPSISIAIFIPLVFALPPPPEYPTPAPTQEYNPDIGQTNVGGYGVNKNPYCHMVEKVVFKNQCEDYTETTCWTQNREECNPKPYITRHWRKLTKFKGASLARTGFATPPIKLT